MKGSRWSAFFVVAVAAMLSACAPATDVSVFGAPFPPFEGEVAVYTDRTSLPAGYVEVGQVVVRDRGSSTMAEQLLLDAVKAEAAAIGANAVLISREGRGTGGAFIGGAYVAGNERILVGLALWIE